MKPFIYNNDGSWETESEYRPAGCGELDIYWWRVVVCDDGTFDVCESSQELLPLQRNGSRYVPSFYNLNLAKAFCQEREKDLLEQKQI